MVDALDVFLLPDGHLLRLCMVTSIVSLRLVCKSVLRELEPLVTFQVLRDMIGYIDTRTYRQVPFTCCLKLEQGRPQGRLALRKERRRMRQRRVPRAARARSGRRIQARD